MMTDWRDLPAGRDLDHLIANQLGIVVKVFIDREETFEGNFVSTKRMHIKTDAGITHLPYYSTDLNAAMQLLTDLPEGTDFDLSVSRVDDLDFADKKWRDLRGKLEFSASFFSGENEDRINHAAADGSDAALVVCQAWLAWKELAKPNSNNLGSL